MFAIAAKTLSDSHTHKTKITRNEDWTAWIHADIIKETQFTGSKSWILRISLSASFILLYSIELEIYRSENDIFFATLHLYLDMYEYVRDNCWEPVFHYYTQLNCEGTKDD
jgi:hypothetical protein